MSSIGGNRSKQGTRATKRANRSKANTAASKGGFEVPKLPKPKRKPRPKQGQTANGGAICGGKKRSGGVCHQPAGHGTNHKGIGKCRLHGGTSPSHIKNAITEGYKVLLGTPIEINPLDALLSCIRITAGEIKWLSDRMAELQEKDWIEQTIVGKQFHLYSRERKSRVQDLARYSQMAISLGIAERAVKLAETYGELLARLIQGILGDLELSADQRAKVPGVVRRHLIALDGGAKELAPPEDLAS